MALSQMASQIKLVSASLKDLVKTASNQLIDTMIPLDERWELFTALSLSGSMDHCGDDCFAAFEHQMSFYDDFYVDRYVQISYIDMLDRLESDLADRVTKDEIVAWKELVLIEAQRRNADGVTNDW